MSVAPSPSASFTVDDVISALGEMGVAGTVSDVVEALDGAEGGCIGVDISVVSG